MEHGVIALWLSTQGASLGAAQVRETYELLRIVVGMRHTIAIFELTAGLLMGGSGQPFV
jgi:hypothetical protein